MPTLNYSTEVMVNRSNARTVEMEGRMAVTGNFRTGEDATGNQSNLESRVYVDRSNARTVSAQ